MQNKKKNKRSKLKKQCTKLLKINLGNERMKKLRESLTTKYNDSLNDISSPLASSSPLDKFGNYCNIFIRLQLETIFYFLYACRGKVTKHS